MTKFELDAHYELVLSVAKEGSDREMCKDHLDVADFEEFFSAIDAMTDEQIEAVANECATDRESMSQECIAAAGSFLLNSVVYLGSYQCQLDFDSDFSLFEEVTNEKSYEFYNDFISSTDIAYCLRFDQWTTEVYSNLCISEPKYHPQTNVQFASIIASEFYAEVGKQPTSTKDRCLAVYDCNPRVWECGPVYSDRNRIWNGIRGSELHGMQKLKGYAEG